MLARTAILYLPYADRQNEAARSRLRDVAACCAMKVIEEVAEEYEHSSDELMNSVFRHLKNGPVGRDAMNSCYRPIDPCDIPVCKHTVLSSSRFFPLNHSSGDGLANSDGCARNEKWYRNEHRMWFFAQYVVDFAVIQDIKDFQLENGDQIEASAIENNFYMLSLNVRSVASELVEATQNYRHILESRTPTKIGHNEPALVAIYEHVKHANNSDDLRTKAIVEAFTNSRGNKYIRNSSMDAERKAMERMLKEFGDYDCFWDLVSRRKSELKVEK